MSHKPWEVHLAALLGDVAPATEIRAGNKSLY